MLHLIKLLSILTVVCGSPWNRVTNGKNITIEERPYQVSLFDGIFYRCGGSILSSRWILTACHCIAGHDLMVVRAGSPFKIVGGLRFISKRLIPHPKFNLITIDYDFGLIDLGENAIPLNGITMKPVQLPSSGLAIPNGTDVEFAGWGSIDNSNTPTSSLLGIDSKILDSDQCGKFFDKSQITDRMICIEPSDRTICHGDSGSPLVLAEDKVQVGISSYIAGTEICSAYDYPAVFSYIANPEVRLWIKDNTGI